jgi:hypothetical protein
VSDSIWNDRVWLALVFGPLVWITVLLSIMGWPRDVAHVATLYSLGMCIGVALVSVFLPVIRGHGRRQ